MLFSPSGRSVRSTCAHKHTHAHRARETSPPTRRSGAVARGRRSVRPGTPDRTWCTRASHVTAARLTHPTTPQPHLPGAGLCLAHENERRLFHQRLQRGSHEYDQEARKRAEAEGALVAPDLAARKDDAVASHGGCDAATPQPTVTLRRGCTRHHGYDCATPRPQPALAGLTGRSSWRRRCKQDSSCAGRRWLPCPTPSTAHAPRLHTAFHARAAWHELGLCSCGEAPWRSEAEPSISCDVAQARNRRTRAGRPRRPALARCRQL